MGILLNIKGGRVLTAPEHALEIQVGQVHVVRILFKPALLYVFWATIMF
jgi:hypothetical protein